MLNRKARVFVAVISALLLSSCAGLGLPVPVGKTIDFQSTANEGVSFQHANDWKVSEVPIEKSKITFYHFKFATFPKLIVSKKEKALWKGSGCVLVVQDTNSTKKHGRENLVLHMHTNLPKSFLGISKPDLFIDVGFESEDMPNVLARLQADYKIKVKLSTYRNGIKLKTTNVPHKWQSYGQAMKTDNGFAYLWCDGDPRYNNHFESLADDLGETLKAS